MGFFIGLAIPLMGSSDFIVFCMAKAYFVLFWRNT